MIGGSSAGATIQGEYLARGDTSGNTIMMGDHEEGFAFVRGVAIDQHLLVRNRHFDLLEITAAKPELLGIGIDEDTAIVVRGNGFEVIGQGYVAIYDNTRVLPNGGGFYFLMPGDRYSLETREPDAPPARGRRVPDDRQEEALIPACDRAPGPRQRGWRWPGNAGQFSRWGLHTGFAPHRRGGTA